MAVDTVCKMQVDEKTAKFKTVYKGTTYYFCAPGCKVVFEENPEKYLKAKQA
ncbi:YHS domain-containing protein [Thermoproteota archaeon]